MTVCKNVYVYEQDEGTLILRFEDEFDTCVLAPQPYRFMCVDGLTLEQALAWFKAKGIPHAMELTGWPKYGEGK